jgi:hypothetical protein
MRRGGTPRLAASSMAFPGARCTWNTETIRRPAYLSTRWQFPEFRQTETSEHDVWMSMIIEIRAGVLIDLCEDLRIRHGHGIVQRNLALVCTEAHRLVPQAKGILYAGGCSACRLAA